MAGPMVNARGGLRNGKKRGFVVRPTRKGSGKQREWLYDLCWRKEDAQGRLLEMPLVMESEWDYRESELVRDFEKLLIARAKYRVFLFYKKTADESPSFVKRLVGQICAYGGTSVGDRYLFGCWPDDDDWQFQQYVHGAGDAA
jgi:hypothetical protein